MTTTHFRFAPGVNRAHTQVVDADGTPILDVVYAPAASIWRINHGWRRGDHNGFQIDPQTGRWQRRDVDAAPGEDQNPDIPRPLAGIKPFVTDSRNLLLVRPLGEAITDELLTTLLYAIKRGIQFVYQVEEQEVAAELIGAGDNRRMMFWEAAEGGTGVWERLVEEPGAFAEVAREALRVCHFNPDTGEEETGHDPRTCAAACYECLLSYANQLEHRYLDRHLVRDFLLRLAQGTTTAVAAGRSREDQYHWLRGLTDPKSGLEIPFLEFLYEDGYRLPDAAQNRPCADVASQPDFYYERDGVPGACVFVDGSDHLEQAREERDTAAREALEDRGFRVITIRFDLALQEQVAQHPDIFDV